MDMDVLNLFLYLLVAAPFICGIGYVVKKKYFTKPVENILMELAGELKLTYYLGTEGRLPFATGTYSGRGVTLDLLNEKGYQDRWHPHSRIVVSVDKNIKDTYIVAHRGRFYSRKLGEVNVEPARFNERFVFLSSNQSKGERLITPDVASWIMNLEMPFILQEGHVIFHMDRRFDDKKRVKYIIDALVYIATMAERIK